MNLPPVSLYFHVPFCTKKCPYCHFYVLPENDQFKTQLLKGFQIEWELWKEKLKQFEVVSIYFGGGTPSLIGPKAIEEILSRISPAHNVEITLEANPENIDHSLIQAYAAVGINRLSVGVQSLDDHLLTLLGRTHDSKKAIEAIHIAHMAGISNISIDLMYDLPQQTVDTWKKTLQRTTELPISHLSLYNLTLEPETVFFKRRTQLQPQLPSQEDSLLMYETACELLEDFGLKRYEISAFAKDGLLSKHNTGYWTARPFIGFGPSAFSYWQNKRFRNIASLNRYMTALNAEKSPVDFEEELDIEARRKELLILQLRMRTGVDIHPFEEQHGRLDVATKAILDGLVEKGFLAKEGSLFKLTHKGTLFYDTVATDLV